MKDVTIVSGGARPHGDQSMLCDISKDGYCCRSACSILSELKANGCLLSDKEAFIDSWNRLCPDEYMADGGRYRLRRYATLSASPSSGAVVLEPHQPHYQKPVYNPLNGGIARHYEPVEEAILSGSTMSAILRFCRGLFGHLSPDAHWHIELHQFRVEATAGKAGKPTPEGVHRDGVDFVFMMMVNKVNVNNGTTTIYDLEKRRLKKFTLKDPFDTAILNDEILMHGVAPISQIDPRWPGYRDVLVITFRRKLRLRAGRDHG